MPLNKLFSHERLVRIAGGFLVISYGIGAPVAAILEYQRDLFSQRFHLPPALIYLTCTAQFVSSIGILLRPFAMWAAAILTVTTIGAFSSHLRIGSIATSIPALFYTVVQVWFMLKKRTSRLSLK